MSFSRRLVSCFALIVVLSGCQTQEPTPAAAVGPGNSGTGPETAVVIGKGHSTVTGVQAEYDWIKQNYPGWQIKYQISVEVLDQHFDVLTISKGSQSKEIWFDITSFYGVL